MAYYVALVNSGVPLDEVYPMVNRALNKFDEAHIEMQEIAKTKVGMHRTDVLDKLSEIDSFNEDMRDGYLMQLQLAANNPDYEAAYLYLATHEYINQAQITADINKIKAEYFAEETTSEKRARGIRPSDEPTML